MNNHIPVMLVITLLLGQIMALPSLSADADTIIISTAAKFKEVMDVAANYGKTFIIEGTETLADGSKGIIIPNTYTAKSTFYGTFIGVDGKNNIQTETHLYNSVTTANGPVLFENIIFKGKNTVGTGTVIASSNGGSGGAILVGQVAVGTEKITFKDITNYINVETGTNSIASLNKVSAGSILGYSNIEAPVEFINCINYGNITNLCSDSTRHSGGIVGLSQKAGGTLLINSCHNYGNVSSLTGSSGGIIGSRANLSADDLITNCSNFGTITSNASSGTLGAGGIAGSIMNVSYSFNAGAVESKMMAGGILGFSSVATVKVNDCFNVGSVTSTDTTNAYFAGGIAGSYAGALYTIENCYNAGAVSGEGAKQIGDTKTAVQDTLCVNNYYVSDEDLGEAIGTNITSTELSAALPTDFDTSKWEFRSAEFLGSNNYLYPQIKGNLYDHKFKLNYKDFANYRSETNGTVSGVTVIDNFNKTTSIYTDVSTTVDTYLTYPGLIGSTLILNESTNTSQGIEFTASKTAEIILEKLRRI